MPKKKSILQHEKNKGKRLSSQEPINYDNKPPIFSLERLMPGHYCFSNLEQKDKAAFAESIFSSFPTSSLGKHSATLRVAGRRASLNEFPNRVWELERADTQVCPYKTPRIQGLSGRTCVFALA